MAKENKKSKNQNPPKEKKTIAEKVQQRLTQLDKKSSNITKQIDSIQKKVDDTSKLKVKIEKLKIDLSKVKKEKELEMDEISLMCSIYAKTSQPNQSKTQPQETPMITST